MRILAHSDYDLGDHVDYTYTYKGRKYPDRLRTGMGYIRQVHFKKKSHMVEDAVFITYLIEPDAMVGYEHDDYFEVCETAILGKAS